MGKAKDLLLKIKLNPKRFFKLFIIGTTALSSGLILVVIGFYLFLSNRIYPMVSVAGIDLSTLTKTQAEQKINLALSERLNKELVFTFNPSVSTSSAAQKTEQTQYFTIKLTPQSVSPGIDDILDEAFEYGHNKIYLQPVNLKIKAQFKDAIDAQIQNIASAIDIQPVDSSLKVEGDHITVTQSQEGKILDKDALKKTLEEYLNTGLLNQNTLPRKTIQPNLSYESALQIKNRLDEIRLSPIKLVFKDQTFVLDLQKILAMIDLQNSKSSLVSADIFGSDFNIVTAKIGNEEIAENKLTLNEQKVNQYLLDISKNINRGVQEPLFSVDPASDPKKPKISEFQPPLEGRTLQIEKANAQLSKALLNPGQSVVELPVEVVPPKNQLVNDLGIKELIGRGISNFAGSIQNRIFNIGLAASKINGMIINPGEEFSFVNTVGDISAATGYKQAYVIKSGRTVLDDGGGVCQVSTTVFRAALNSGLPITARTAHAYRVAYYEQGFPPGLDATIFHPSVDFRFKNDTPASILIQAYVNGTTLNVDLYGTSDGRVAQISKPVITSQTPPPPELRQDDPTLPKGTVKQVDFAAWGANVVFTRKVERNGQVIINESYKSNYRPWQAVFLVGTKEG